MFRFDESGQPVEVKLVDWQVTRLGHPGSDVAQFLFTSASPETLRNHRDELINHYYDVLSSSMEKLGLKTYDRHLFLLEVKNRFRFGYFTALAFIDRVLSNPIQKDSDEGNNDPKNEKEIEEQQRTMSDLEKVLLKNSLLRQRVVELTKETKSAVQK